MKLPNISPKTFYTVGKYAFFVNATGMLIGLVDSWTTLAGSQIASTLAMSFFYFVLSGFFASMGKQEDMREVKDGDIIKMSEALNKLELDKKDASKR